VTNGASKSETACRFGVHRATLKRYCKQLDERGTLRPRKTPTAYRRSNYEWCSRHPLESYVTIFARKTIFCYSRRATWDNLSLSGHSGALGDAGERSAVRTILLTLAHFVYLTVPHIGYTAPLLYISRSLLPRQSAHPRYRLYRCWRR
jgi:hypothetical protein